MQVEIKTGEEASLRDGVCRHRHYMLAFAILNLTRAPELKHGDGGAHLLYSMYYLYHLIFDMLVPWFNN